MCVGSRVVVRKTVANMSHLWDPPDPYQERNFHGGRSNRAVGIVLLVLMALVVGGATAYVLSQWQDARTPAAAAPTAAPTTASTSTTSTTTTTTIAPTTTSTTTTTIAATTTTFAPVVGDHMVFADGYPLGHISPSGFAQYQGDAASQLRQGVMQMSSVVNFVGSQFSAQVRPLDPLEMSPTCPVTVQPRAGDNAEPLGLWVEAPNWQLQPTTAAAPVPLNDPRVVAVIQLITANNAVSPAPPPKSGSAVLVDLIGDGLPDLIVSANYSDDSIYYRLVAVAPDGNPDAATTVMIEFGGSFRDDGSRDPQSRGELRVDGVVEMTGAPPFELFIRRTTSNTKGVSIRDIAGTELASYTCPRS
ncbi:MAG: hypothetical protein QOH53_2193 [Ilumatobacteraceae bacterium]